MQIWYLIQGKCSSSAKPTQCASTHLGSWNAARCPSTFLGFLWRWWGPGEEPLLGIYIYLPRLKYIYIYVLLLLPCLTYTPDFRFLDPGIYPLFSLLVVYPAIVKAELSASLQRGVPPKDCWLRVCRTCDLIPLQKDICFITFLFLQEIHWSNFVI